MDANQQRIRDLEVHIQDLETQLQRFREDLREARERACMRGNDAENKGDGPGSRKFDDGVNNINSKKDGNNNGDIDTDGDAEGDASNWNWPMKREEYKRYGRQLIMPEVGIRG